MNQNSFDENAKYHETFLLLISVLLTFRPFYSAGFTIGFFIRNQAKPIARTNSKETANHAIGPLISPFDMEIAEVKPVKAAPKPTPVSNGLATSADWFRESQIMMLRQNDNIPQRCDMKSVALSGKDIPHIGCTKSGIKPCISPRIAKETEFSIMKFFNDMVFY